MLKIKALVFVQDESHEDNGVRVADLYSRKVALTFLPNPMQSAEACIKENIERALARIMEDVDRTLKVESTGDIEYFYEKNKIGGMP